MNSQKITNLILAVFCLGVFFASAGAAYAAKESQEKKLPVEASAAVDKASIEIGDKITYTITVKAQKNIEVEFPQILPENLAGFAIKDFGLTQTGWFGKKTFKQWYLLDTYVSGEHAIPAVEIKYRAKGATDWQGSGKVNVKEVKVEVKSVLDTAATKAEIRDIRGPKSFTEKMWFYMLIGLAVLLIIGAVFTLIFLNKKRQEHLAPPIPAHIIAYEALAALEKKDYIRKGQTQAYYTELSDIVRHYLENRFNLRAPEMTTEEFLIHLNSVSINPEQAMTKSGRVEGLIKLKEDSVLSLEHKGLLREFLVNCDLVKFAKYQPAEQEANLSFTSAKKLIDQTKEQEAGGKLLLSCCRERFETVPYSSAVD